MTKVKLNHIDLGGDQCQLPVDTNLYILVQELPERGKKDKIYLVKDDTAPEGNVYNEYSFINGAWESLGQHSSTIDVEVPTKLSQLENDSEFVKSASLGTAAFKDVEDLQGGNDKWNLLQTISLSGSAQSFPLISKMGDDLYTDGLLVVVNSSQDLTFNFGYGADQIKGKVIEVERLGVYPEYGTPASMQASFLIKGDNSAVIDVVHPGFGEPTITVSISNGGELSGMIRLFYKKTSNLKS